MLHILCDFFFLFLHRSTSQRGAAWVPPRIGRRSRRRLQPTGRRGLSTARTATASVSGPWSSTWPLSTCWRASRSPEAIHLPPTATPRPITWSTRICSQANIFPEGHAVREPLISTHTHTHRSEAGSVGLRRPKHPPESSKWRQSAF